MTDRRLVLLRHAKSDQHVGGPDHARPLNVRGRRDGPEAGRWLRMNVGTPDTVVCSSSARTRETWDLVSSKLPDPPQARFADAVYDASAIGLLEIVRGLPDESACALLIGHNPAVEDLTTLLAGEYLPMTTSAFAVLTWHGTWSDVGIIPATLQAHAAPRG
ncbi:SixA phosphatase family protein [Pseudonocardia benzenivorans]|jgi:phosphohistidine phosphatase|uniref:Phosphohistidine phosphatase, SixA n=2 Tax=Pseudonocardia TaxID=1847 RepID=F4CQ42_PSEUX|nr:histidine phosphatase family protein [Pseudonocardia dioxanivorans]AEA27238.1 putative phosphohistidine phosphatase, SixA [Pseudonocardia dioxanivorans CB1190]GJF07137.1 phosphohistidine phosphatase [Pseudonocardia sp. D17]